MPKKTDMRLMETTETTQDWRMEAVMGRKLKRAQAETGGVENPRGLARNVKETTGLNESVRRS